MDLWSPLPRNLGASLRDAVHPKARVRLSAVADLARWAQGGERDQCLGRLLALFEADSDIEVRAAAALGLADAGLHEALPALLRAVTSAPPRVAQMALVAIGELAPPGDSDALVAVRGALASNAPAIRFQALVAAGRSMPLSELSRSIEQALEEPDAKLRYIAVRIIEERFFADADPNPAGPERDLAARLQEKLEPLLSDPAAEVAIAVAVLLAPRGSAAACAALVNALNRQRSFTHVEDELAAIETCADLGLDAARPGLAARAFRGAWLGSSSVAFSARVGLARLGDERARQHILRGLSSWSRSVRAQCVAAAGLARLQAARPRLLEMRRDERVVDAHSVTEALLALDR